MTSVLPWLCLWALTWRGVSPSSLTYKSDTYPGNCFSLLEDLEAFSLLVCSMRCARTLCAGFSFSEGGCQMYDLGADTQTSIGTRKYEAFYGPDDDDDATTNIAGDKPILPTTFWGLGYATNAVDGDAATEYISATFILPWLSVDLEAHYVVKAIRVLPNTFFGKFRQITVFVGATKALAAEDLTAHKAVGAYEGPYTDASVGWLEFFPNETACGRFVSLRGTSEHMHVFEMEVFV